MKVFASLRPPPPTRERVSGGERVKKGEEIKTGSSTGDVSNDTGLEWDRQGPPSLRPDRIPQVGGPPPEPQVSATTART